MELLRLRDVFAAFFQDFVIRKIPELVIEGHCFAPIRHGALGFAGGRVGKRLFGFFVLEGVEKRDPFFDGGLDRRGTTCGEIHSAELIRARPRQSICAECRRLKNEKSSEQAKGRDEP